MRTRFRKAMFAAGFAATLSPATVLFAGTIVVDAGRGNVTVRVPDSGTPPFPLVVFLHGYNSNAASSEAFFAFGAKAEAAGMLYATPNGSQDPLGLRYWNATDACCDFFHSGVDDSTYLTNLVAAIDSTVGVDPHRLFFVGHSNGGFMSYRFACDHADEIAAVVSLAGATFDDSAACTPLRPVSTLQIHGTSDTVIQFGGGTLPGADGPYPAAADTAATWAAYNGCENSTVALDSFNGVDGLPGTETEVERYELGCSGAATELWTVNGGPHSPAINDTLRDRVIAFLVDAGNRVFTDGFETGSTFAWSSSVGEL